MEQNRIYLALDLKSFYASVECMERGLNPLSTNLVVADLERTEKTICLAVSPSLKAFGISGRARLFEVVKKVREVNDERRKKAPEKHFSGKSFDATELERNAALSLDYIVAPPRMAYYMDYSTRVYNIYLKYVAPEDIHVYSIDEVFIDVTSYLAAKGMTAREFAILMIRDVLKNTGITTTAGIGTNLYLAKVAMDVVAKRVSADKDGVRIAELDEQSYRKSLWSHTPLTDFWRVGRGYAQKLCEHGIYTMGDIARCSIGKQDEYYNEDLLYELFGVNAELLIDHAWGWEPCTIAQIKAYKPKTNSIGSGQVLQQAYSADKARLIVREMTDLLTLDLVDKGLVTDQMVLTVGYDIENMDRYTGEATTDNYGRKIPKHAHGTVNLSKYTASTKLITDAVISLYDKIVDKKLSIRRLNLTANHVEEEDAVKTEEPEQLDLFTDYCKKDKIEKEEQLRLEREKRRQQAVIGIKKKYGKNAIIKGMNLQDGATARERNRQIGGHKA